MEFNYNRFTSQKEKIEGSLLEVYLFFFALINSQYSISSLDCFTNIKRLSTNYFSQISKAQNAFDPSIFYYIREIIKDSKNQEVHPTNSYLTYITSHPFMINLCFTFENAQNYYFIYEYAEPLFDDDQMICNAKTRDKELLIQFKITCLVLCNHSKHVAVQRKSFFRWYPY